MTTKPLLVVVDDTDGRIKYSKGWFEDNGSQDKFGNNGPTYRHTQHGIKANGTFTFNFTGTYVKVYGTTDYAKTGDNSFDPVLNCNVDGMDVYTVTPQTARNNNQVLCTNETLPDGPHQLTVNVASKGQTFWFDYIRFQPSSNLDPTNLQNETLFFDDQYNTISYSNAWSLLNDSLAHYTQKKGANVKFDFNGTGITWYGQIPQGYAQDSTSGSYTIDGRNPTTFSIVGPSDNTTKQYYQPFFSATGLRSGSHSLAVTYQGDENHAPLTLDYLIVDPSSGSGASKAKSTTPIGAIVGGVVGGVAFLVIVGIVLFFLLRRQNPLRRRRSRLSIVPLDPSSSPIATSHPHDAGHVEAFVDSNDMRQVNRRSNSQSYLMAPLSSSGRSSDNGSGTSQSYMQVTNGDGASADGSLGSRPSKGQIPVSERRAREIHHEDSGLRLPQNDDQPVVEFPPSYSAR